MPELPARRIDDRELRPELAFAAQVIGNSPRPLARGTQFVDDPHFIDDHFGRV
jgi:hypothetical protein